MQDVMFLLKCNSGGPDLWFLAMNRCMQKMAGSVGAVLMLLLTSVHTDINGKAGFKNAGETYKVTLPCGQEDACYDGWVFSGTRRGHLIAVVRNGELRTSESEVDNSKCTIQKETQMEKDVGRPQCQHSPESTAAPEIILRPGEMLSLQCVFLSYIKSEHCYTTLTQWKNTMELMWADEAGAPIQKDSNQQIKQRSPCDTTLTVNLDGPANKSFVCQVIMDGKLRNYAVFRVRVPGFKGRGRGLILEPQPEHQGHSDSKIGAAMGVAGCLVLTAIVAAFAVRRRRRRRRGRTSKNQQTPDESCYTISNNNDMNSDEVLYADIVLPITSGGLQIQEFDSTEYACIRYE